jgi:hypothetical protein
MKTIETTAVVGDDREMTVQLPPDVAPGPHQIVVVLDVPARKEPHTWSMNDWPVHDARISP